MTRWQLPFWMDLNVHRAKRAGSHRVRMEACGDDRPAALERHVDDVHQQAQAAKAALTKRGLLMEDEVAATHCSLSSRRRPPADQPDGSPRDEDQFVQDPGPQPSENARR